MDIGIYIFGPWLWTLGIRLLQGRQLLARTGKRALVIGDVAWVQQTLRNYVSKLFSLSYGIASLEVQGANPQDHLVHKFGHRVVRARLTAFKTCAPALRWLQLALIQSLPTRDLPIAWWYPAPPISPVRTMNGLPSPTI